MDVLYFIAVAPRVCSGGLAINECEVEYIFQVTRVI
jgi:hypothetical protein